MAIVIEEEQNKTNIIGIVTWLVILAIIAVAAYYVFFKAPPFVEVAPPTNLINIDPLAHLNIDPGAVVNGQSFQSLKQYITPPEPGNAGRPNPFLAP